MKRSELYKQIKKRITEKFPELQHVSPDTGSMKGAVAATFPACMVDFSPVTWMSGTDGKQTGECNLRISVVAKNPGTEQEVLALWDLADTIFQTMHLFKCNGMDALQRVQDGEWVDDEGYLLFTTEFRTILTDYQPVSTSKIPKPAADFTKVR